MKKSSKILLYGILVSILFIASCLYMEKMVSVDRDDSVVENISDGEKEISIESVLSKNDRELEEQSTIEYKIGKGVISIDGRMPLLDISDPLKNSMMKMCGLVHCDRPIIFSPDVKTPKWKSFAKEIIDLFYEENLSYAYFFADKNSNITIGGELLSKVSKDKLDFLLEKYKQFTIDNRIKLKILEVVKKEVVVEPNIREANTTKINTIKEHSSDIEVAQEEIVNILKDKKINFVRNRARITKKGIETLNEIIVVLKKVPDVKIEVRGYTDASGKRAINRWISEERAKSVRNYLGSSGINPVNIEAKGFGEDNLLYEDKPYSKLNRRVEIGIKRR